MSQEKQNAARTAVDQIEDGMLVGLGTGSTAAFAISYLGEKVRSGLTISAIPTSEASKKQAQSEGIPLIDFETSPSIDLCIDGADEIDYELNMIIDSSKQVETLGTFPLPVEVIPFGWQVVTRKLKEMNASPELRKSGPQPFVTDEGNYILDCRFNSIPEVEQLEAELNRIPGVVENGLFVAMCDQMIMGKGDQVILKERR